MESLCEFAEGARSLVGLLELLMSLTSSRLNCNPNHAFIEPTMDVGVHVGRVHAERVLWEPRVMNWSESRDKMER
jgi:hypothetical protein